MVQSVRDVIGTTSMAGAQEVAGATSGGVVTASTQIGGYTLGQVVKALQIQGVLE